MAIMIHKCFSKSVNILRKNWWFDGNWWLRIFFDDSEDSDYSDEEEIKDMKLIFIGKIVSENEYF